ncbi:MAG: hypothetical protein ACLFWF_11700 [Alphaproteobacteria bacterium]
MEIDHLSVRLDADISGFRRGLTEAAAVMGRSGAAIAARVEETQTALSGLGEGLDAQAAQIGEMLEGVARSLKSAFGRAFDQILRNGEADLGGLIRGLSRDLARLGLDTVFGALGKQASGLLGGLIGRAAGGPVATDTAYLVGERGPEVFVPPSPGRIAPAPAGGINVTFNVQATDAQSFLQSEAQIQSMLGRAVVRGQKFRSS